MCEFLSRMGFPVSAVVEPAEVPSNQLSTSTLRPVEVKEEEEHCEDDLFWGLWDTDALLSAVSLGGHWPSFLHNIPQPSWPVSAALPLVRASVKCQCDFHPAHPCLCPHVAKTPASQESLNHLGIFSRT